MDNKTVRGFGVLNYLHHILLLASSGESKKRTFRVLMSNDGLQFFFYDDTGVITRAGETLEDIERTDDFRIAKQGDEYYGTYTLTSDRKTLNLAHSHDGVHFQKIGRINGIESVGMLVPEFKWNDKYVVYYGNHALKVGFSPDLKSWDFQKDTHLTPVKHRKLTIATIVVRDEGIYVFYFAVNRHDVEQKYSLNALLFDKNEPGKQLWDKEKVVWKQNDEFEGSAYPMGLAYFDHVFLSYWRLDNGSVKAVIHHFLFASGEAALEVSQLVVEKHPNNPILSPLHNSLWESEAAFNAAAIYEDGKVHLIYRAVGSGGVSMLGYATSSDGLTIDTRSRHPIYFPRESFEGAAQKTCQYPRTYISGPGSGGCEDPRIAKVDGRYYLTYVAFNGWFPRLAMSSISEQDFKSQNWNWTRPVVISQPNVVDKSGAILPEKVSGKYVIFHRVFPHILVDFVDSLEDLDGKTNFLKGEYKIGPRKYHWDSRKVGVGATPLKTDDGWLVIYNAVDDRDDSKYKIGAMLLDLKDPTQVIARSENPILEPTEHYENGGLKYGIVYPCGAVNIDNQLIVYYGGSDQYLCAATAPMNYFVSELKKHGTPQLSAKYAKRVHPILPS